MRQKRKISMAESIGQRILALGALRLLLYAMAIILILLLPFADVTLPPYGWGLLFGSVLPAAAPIIFMVLMLDLMMCLVLRVDADNQRRTQLGFAVKLHLLVGGLLVLVWLPVFLRAL
jgi:hypothetical protein